MKRLLRTLGYSGVFGWWLLGLLTGQAQVPQLLHFQGRVTVAGVPFHGVGEFKFALVNGAGTATYWSNDGTSTEGNEPTAAVVLTVSQGLYTVRLGDATLPNMTGVPATVFFHPEVALRVWFNDGTHGSQWLSPDQRIAAVGYALMAENAVTATTATTATTAITATTATTATIAATVEDGAITSAKLAPGAVDGSKILDGSLTATKFGSGIGLWEQSGANLFYGSGYVGIGVATPLAPLHLQDLRAADFPAAIFAAATPLGTWLSLNNTSGGGRNWNFISTGSASAEGPGKLLFHDQSGGGTRLIISEYGNVGIGAELPAEKLEVGGRVVVGDSENATPKAGTIRWTGREFQGFNGTRWESFSSDPNVVTPVSGMVWIHAGSFAMGSPGFEVDGDAGERPQTSVTISRGFWMGSREVTQGEYLAVMGSNPSAFVGDLNRPVDSVSWHDAVAYCNQLTTLERTAGRILPSWSYRLPTEAEWEYVARVGTGTRFSYGDDLPSYANLANYAWYYDNSAFEAHAVGGRAPNAWGLYDLYGNVWEWCQDWHGTYPGGQLTDPRGPGSGSHRVIRGGSWLSLPVFCRSAFRNFILPGSHLYHTGFRAVLAPVQP